jgi:hypothetical protein
MNADRQRLMSANSTSSSCCIHLGAFLVSSSGANDALYYKQSSMLGFVVGNVKTVPLGKTTKQRKSIRARQGEF